MLSDDHIQQQLNQLPGWSLNQGKLHKQFEFKDFSQAFAFMTGVALKAEKMDHHPDWSNCYNSVTIDLFTHSEKGLTPLDFKLAAAIEAIQ